MKRYFAYLTFSFLASTVVVEGHGKFRLIEADNIRVRAKITKITRSLSELRQMSLTPSLNERIGNKEQKLKILRSSLNNDANLVELDEQFQMLQIQATYFSKAQSDLSRPDAHGQEDVDSIINNIEVRSRREAKIREDIANLTSSIRGNNSSVRMLIENYNSELEILLELDQNNYLIQNGLLAPVNGDTSTKTQLERLLRERSSLQEIIRRSPPEMQPRPAVFNVNNNNNVPAAIVQPQMETPPVQAATKPRELDTELQEAVAKSTDFSNFYNRVLEAQSRVEDRSNNEILKNFLSSLVFLSGTIEREVRKALRVEEARRSKPSEGDHKYVLNLALLSEFQKILELHLGWVTNNDVSDEMIDRMGGFIRETFSVNNHTSAVANMFRNLHFSAIYAIYKSPEFKNYSTPTCLDHYLCQTTFSKCPIEMWQSSSESAHTRTQGWKLHVSAKPETALKVLLIVKPILERFGVHYKYAGSMAFLKWINQLIDQKGKFITIYPESDEQAAQIARELDRALQVCARNDFETTPFDAPLGNSGGLYTRYGGFTTDTLEEIDSQGRILQRQPDFRMGPYRPSWIRSTPFGSLLSEPENLAARYQP